jgi:hypothetical protein
MFAVMSLGSASQFGITLSISFAGKEDNIGIVQTEQDPKILIL